MASAARTADRSSAATATAITAGVRSMIVASTTSSRRRRLISSYSSRLSRRSRSRRFIAERISGTHRTHSPNSEAAMQSESTLSLPGSSTYRLANADESKNVFTGSLFENRRRERRSLRREAQARSPPRRRSRHTRRHWVNLGDRLTMPQHNERFPAFDRVEKRRRLTTKIGERNRFQGSRLQAGTSSETVSEP